MIPCPIALGLTVCDYVIIEERTKKVSLIGGFTGIGVSRFPAVPAPFSVFAVLTDGLGDATIKLSVSQLDTQEQVLSREMPGHFPDRLAELRIHFRISQASFPSPGWYQVSLLVDGEWVAQRRIRVYLSENPS
jgi:hypothetical protein